MNTGGGKEPREHFSSFFNTNVIRNEHWRREGAKRAFLIMFKYEFNKE